MLCNAADKHNKLLSGYCIYILFIFIMLCAIMVLLVLLLIVAVAVVIGGESNFKFLCVELLLTSEFFA